MAQDKNPTYLLGVFFGSRVKTKPTFSILLHRLSWDHMGLCTAASDLRKIASELRKLPPFFGPCRDHVGRMWDLCWPHVGPCWALGSYVGAMLSLC